MIDIDYSVILQAISLFLFFLFMRKFLFIPLKDLLEARENRLETAEEGADAMRRAVGEIDQKVETSMRLANQAASGEMRRLESEAKREASARLAAEKDRLDKDVAERMAEIDRIGKELRRELSGKAASFGQELAGILLAANGVRDSGGGAAE